MSSDKRDITKLIRFNDREYQIVMENANACNMNFSAYVRYAISNIKMPNPDMRKHILKLINEVNHIGNNVNQIVRNNNSGLYMDSDKTRLMEYMRLLNLKVGALWKSMAISRILHMNSHHRSKGSHLQVAIDYILKDEKTMNGLLTGSVNCIKENAYECMKETKRLYGKMDKRQGYHLIISFEENECDGDIAMKVIEEFVHEYLESDYEVVYAVHTNTDHVHGHIIWNSVRFTDGYKYHYKKGDWEKDIQPRVDRICEKYNLSTLEKSIEKTDKKEWDVLKDGPFVWNEQIKQDIDACVLRASDYSMFLQMLEAEGYEIKQGKYLAVKPPGMERFRRTKTLGQGYGIDELKERIVKENLNTYRSNRVVKSSKKSGNV